MALRNVPVSINNTASVANVPCSSSALVSQSSSPNDHLTIKTTSSTIFTPEEDRIILQCVSSGMKWSEIAKKIWNKNGKQCMERWLNHLDPSRLSRGGWTPEEDAKLRQAHAKHGPNWVKIAAMFPGKSEMAVKNRWWSLPNDAFKPLNDSHRSTPLTSATLWKVPSKPFTTTSAQPLAPTSSALAKPPAFTQVRTDDRKRKAHNLQSFPQRVMKPMPQPMVPLARTPASAANSTVPNKPMNTTPLSARLPMAAPPPINVSSMVLPTPNFFATPAPKPPQPSAVLKIDASMSILPPPSAQIHTQDMKELAEAFVREEVERQKRTNGVTITKAEQDMMRNAFLAGMQHSPDEKDQSTADLRWEFDQSESLDAMGFSFDDAEDLNNLGSSFDGLIEGHGIHPTAMRRPDPSIISGGLRTPVAGQSGNSHHFGQSFHGSTEASAWSGINTSDIIDTDVNDMSLSMSMLNMSLDVEESQDQIVSASDVAGIFSSD